MTRRTENKYKGRSQSGEYAKDGKSFGGGRPQNTKAYSSFEPQGTGANKYAPPRTTGHDNRPKTQAYGGDKYGSPPVSARETKHGPSHWDRSGPDRHSVPAYGPATGDVPRKDSFVPHKDIPTSRTDLSRPVEASALIKGLEAGRDEITALLQTFVGLAAGDFAIKEIELSLSFNSSGKFLGFGVGGATSVKIKVAPTARQ